MSKKAAGEFLTRLRHDQSVQSAALSVVTKAGDKSAVSASDLADVAIRFGYDLTPEELMDLLTSEATVAEGELSDAELAAVAGGIKIDSLVTFPKIEISMTDLYVFDQKIVQ